MSPTKPKGLVAKSVKVYIRPARPFTNPIRRKGYVNKRGVVLVYSDEGVGLIMTKRPQSSAKYSPKSKANCLRS